jgi:hypothetical protein
MITGESLCPRKSLILMRIDRSIVYPRTSDTATQRTSLDSLLGVGRPARDRVICLHKADCCNCHRSAPPRRRQRR